MTKKFKNLYCVISRMCTNVNKKLCICILIHFVVCQRRDNMEISNNMRCHFTIIKFTGVFLILGLTLTTVTIISTVHSNCTENNTTTYQNINLNMTLCDFIKMFPLSYDMAVTICVQNGETRIDIRQFLNDKPTIRGIYLTTDQWQRFKTMFHDIDEGLLESRIRSLQ